MQLDKPEVPPEQDFPRMFREEPQLEHEVEPAFEERKEPFTASDHEIIKSMDREVVNPVFSAFPHGRQPRIY